MKAKLIQCRLHKEFEGIVIRMGSFHITMNCLAVLGKRCHMPDIEDQLRIWHVRQFNNLDPSEKKILQAWSEGPQLVMEAMFRMHWSTSCSGSLSRRAVIWMNMR